MGNRGAPSRGTIRIRPIFFPRGACGPPGTRGASSATTWRRSRWLSSARGRVRGEVMASSPRHPLALASAADRGPRGFETDSGTRLGRTPPASGRAVSRANSRPKHRHEATSELPPAVGPFRACARGRPDRPSSAKRRPLHREEIARFRTALQASLVPGCSAN